MMAYAKLIWHRCSKANCNKDATHSVFGNRNQRYGDYCEKHAEELIASINLRAKAFGKKEN